MKKPIYILKFYFQLEVEEFPIYHFSLEYSFPSSLPFYNLDLQMPLPNHVEWLKMTKKRQSYNMMK